MKHEEAFKHEAAFNAEAEEGTKVTGDRAAREAKGRPTKIQDGGSGQLQAGFYHWITREALSCVPRKSFQKMGEGELAQRSMS